MPLPLLPLFSSLINTFFFFSLFFPTYVSSDAEGYSACEPFSCGKIDISYPFWSIDHQPAYCGHPYFKLDCQQDNVTIDMMSQRFHVIEINQTSKILKMARLDLWDDPCTDEYSDVKLDSDFFSYTSNDDDYTLLYGCDPISSYTPTVNIEGTLTFSCPIDVGFTNSYFVLSRDLVNFKDLGCKNSINVSVLREAVKDAVSVLEVLEEGFEVGWSSVDEDQCDDCRKSGGRCGHNVSMDAFMCLCLNQQSHGVVCNKSLASSPLAAPAPRPIPENSLQPPNSQISPKQSPRATSALNLPRKIIIGVPIAVMGGFVIYIITCYSKCMSSTQVNFGCTINDDHGIEAFLKNHGALAQRRYKFSEVKKMTNSFKVKLGEGGFGAVYKGEMLNACPVAVKILNASKGNGEDFINEVASISRTSHVNVVTLLGFCLEGHKKALIYEFMPNGSLDKFIYNKGQEMNESLSWDNLWQIAVGIARGLEYLHRGCNTRILHFDIKPHNILLDDKFCPKISDFGLAKLCPRNESIISMSNARGTIGYVAPEVWNKHFGGISHKSDVYSYGMMLLEVVGVKKNINPEASKKSSEYFPDWIYNRLEQDRDLTTDGVIATKENEIARRMTIVGLWCVQTFPKDRPTMSRVIEMLEGNMNSLEIPPKPVLSSPTRSVPELTTSSFQSG